MQGLVDTHCHLQAPAFEADLAEVVARARAAGVADMVVCAGGSDDWERTACVAREHGLAYMLGIHPLLVPKAHEEDLERLSALAEASMADPHFIGIGEIGLEGLVMTIDARQEHFFREQLRIAARLDLPCSIHVRKSASRLLYHLRRIRVTGVVHAFNGSDAERDAFLALGLKLARRRRHLRGEPEDQAASRRGACGRLRARERCARHALVGPKGLRRPEVGARRRRPDGFACRPASRRH